MMAEERGTLTRAHVVDLQEAVTVAIHEHQQAVLSCLHKAIRLAVSLELRSDLEVSSS